MDRRYWVEYFTVKRTVKAGETVEIPVSPPTDVVDIISPTDKAILDQLEISVNDRDFVPVRSLLPYHSPIPIRSVRIRNNSSSDVEVKLILGDFERLFSTLIQSALTSISDNVNATIIGDQVGLAKETTLQAIRSQTDKFRFDDDSYLWVHEVSSIDIASKLGSLTNALDSKNLDKLLAVISRDDVGLAKDVSLSDIKKILGDTGSSYSDTDEDKSVRQLLTEIRDRIGGGRRIVFSVEDATGYLLPVQDVVVNPPYKIFAQFQGIPVTLHWLDGYGVIRLVIIDNSYTFTVKKIYSGHDGSKVDTATPIYAETLASNVNFYEGEVKLGGNNELSDYLTDNIGTAIKIESSGATESMFILIIMVG